MFWDKYRLCISSSIGSPLTLMKYYRYNGWNNNYLCHIIFSSSSIKLDRNLMKFLGKEKKRAGAF